MPREVQKALWSHDARITQATVERSHDGCLASAEDDGTEADQDAAPEDDDAELPSDDEEDGDAAGREPGAPQSKHGRRQAALAARIAALEATNMAEKDWFMRGEAKAGASRPVAPCSVLWRRTKRRVGHVLSEISSCVRRRHHDRQSCKLGASRSRRNSACPCAALAEQICLISRLVPALLQPVMLPSCCETRP